MPPSKRYQPKQASLTSFTKESFAPEFATIVEGDRASLEALVATPRPGIVEFPLFSAEYAQALLREAHAFEHWCRHHGTLPTRPNSMNNHGVVLAELGLEDAMDDLLVTWLAPLTRTYFAEHAGATLDHQHSFLVDYSEAGDTALDFHVDDSEVTLNVCLGLEFEGADVYFQGARCDAHRSEPANDTDSWQWSPKPGRAILHAGANRHGVHPLVSGRRINLIVWARSSRHRRLSGSTHAPSAAWCPSCKAA